jgi:hypothetical protein
MSTSENQTAGSGEGMRRVVSATDNVDMEVETSSDHNEMMVEYDNTDGLSASDQDENMAVPTRLTAMRRSISSSSSLSDSSGGLLPEEPFTREQEMAEFTGQTYHFDNIVESTSNPLSSAQNRLVNFQTQRQGSRMSSGHRNDDSATGSSDSFRARSENSSNDWGYGWYEDVHGSEHMAPKADKKSTKRPGLVPRIASIGEVEDSGPKGKQQSNQFFFKKCSTNDRNRFYNCRRRRNGSHSTHVRLGRVLELTTSMEAHCWATPTTTC